MITISDFKGFSHPDIPASESFYAVVAQGYTNSVLTQCLEVGLPRNIVTALAGWIAQPKPLSQVWYPSVSKLGRRAFEEGKMAQGECLGRLLIDLAPNLDDFEFDFIAESALPIQFDNKLFSVSGNVHIKNNNGVLIVAGTEESYEFARVDDIGVIETRQSSASLCADGAVAIPLDYTSCGRFGWDDAVSNGLEVMTSVSDVYGPWIRRVLKTLILIEGMENRTCSGSWLDTSGVVYMSQPHSAIEVGEVLIHECSHQHFHMATRVMSMTTPEENGMYFSPPVGRERPLDMILIAYHAFANVLTYYERVFDLSLGNRIVENRYQGFKNEVEILDGYLAGNLGLSTLGKVIYEHLKDMRKLQKCSVVLDLDDASTLNYLSPDLKGRDSDAVIDLK